MKNRSSRYDINKHKPTYGHRYSEYNICLSLKMLYVLRNT